MAHIQPRRHGAYTLALTLLALTGNALAMQQDHQRLGMEHFDPAWQQAAMVAPVCAQPRPTAAAQPAHGYSMAMFDPAYHMARPPQPAAPEAAQAAPRRASGAPKRSRIDALAGEEADKESNQDEPQPKRREPSARKSSARVKWTADAVLHLLAMKTWGFSSKDIQRWLFLNLNQYHSEDAINMCRRNKQGSRSFPYRRLLDIEERGELLEEIKKCGIPAYRAFYELPEAGQEAANT